MKVLVCIASVLGAVKAGSDFAGNLASCAAGSTLNFCLKQTLEDLRPLMKTGIPQLRIPPTEPMNVDTIAFQQGQPPVVVSATFNNVIVKGLSTFVTNYIEADPNSQTLRIGLTVPQMDIQGFYQINGEVFILPLEGSGTFTTKMSDITAVGASSILPVTGPNGKTILKVDNTNIDFDIGKVNIHMDNLFNGDNQLLADTVNKFLNDHGQEVLAEVKPEISRQLTNLVTRVMNDAFSELPADQLINNLGRSARSGDTGLFSTRIVPFSFQQNQDRQGKTSLLSLLTHGRRHSIF